MSTDDLTDESWEPIPGFERFYEVSDLGRVRSLDRVDALGALRQGRILQPSTSPYGHLHVSLYVGGRRHTRRVHRLVLEAFAGIAPDGTECCHNNGDPTDNRLENLRWDTPGANRLDSVGHGTHHEARKTTCPQGHAYDDANTYIYRARRSCRTCHRARDGAYRARRRGVTS